MDSIDEQDWQSYVTGNLNQLSTNVAANSLKDFVVVNFKIYCCSNDGVSDQVLSLIEAKE